MSIGAELRETVISALQDIGVPMVLRKRVEGSFDPVSGVVLTEYDYGCIGVFTTISLFNRSEVVQAGDRAVLIADVEQDRKPETGDYLLYGNEKFSVAKVSEVAPDGFSVCFDLLVRH